MQPLISMVSHSRDFCFPGVFVQVSRAEQLLKARAVLPGDGTATELGVSSARSSFTGGGCPKGSRASPLLSLMSQAGHLEAHQLP